MHQIHSVFSKPFRATHSNPLLGALALDWLRRSAVSTLHHVDHKHFAPLSRNFRLAACFASYHFETKENKKK